MMLTLNFSLRRLAAASHARRPPPTNTTIFSSTRHFAQGERIACRAQVNHVAQVDARHRRRTGRLPMARQALLNSIVSPLPSTCGQAAIDVQLCHHPAQTRLDFVVLVPAGIMVRELLHVRHFFAQEELREHPALVRQETFGPDQVTLPRLSNFRMLSQTLPPAMPAPMMR